MSWLWQVPVQVPGAPNFTWAAWIWAAGLVMGGVGFLRLGRHAARGLRAANGQRGRAEHWLALGLLIQQIDSLAMVLAGLVALVLGVTGPRQAAVANVRTAGILLALLLFAILKGIQGQVAVWFHERALAALPKEKT